MDITNHYIVQAINGGIMMLWLFLAIITNCFKTIGGAVRRIASLPFDEKIIWGFGVALSAHCASFVSVSYFDQIKVFWFWLLAVIALVSTAEGQMVQSEFPAESRLAPDDNPRDSVLSLS